MKGILIEKHVLKNEFPDAFYSGSRTIAVT
jgi:hypothetical protein